MATYSRLAAALKNTPSGTPAMASVARPSPGSASTSRSTPAPRAPRIIGQSVGPDADADLADHHMGGPDMAPHTPQRSWRPGGAVAPLDTPRRSWRPGGAVAPLVTLRVPDGENADGVVAAVGGEDEIGRRDQCARDGAQPRDGADVLLRLDVDDVDGVVRGVGDVDAPGGFVHGGVIEAAALRMRGQVDEAEMLERHVSARPRARRPGVRRSPRCGRARPRSRRSPPERPTARRADLGPARRRSRSSPRGWRCPGRRG